MNTKVQEEEEKEQHEDEKQKKHNELKSETCVQKKTVKNSSDCKIIN